MVRTSPRPRSTRSAAAADTALAQTPFCPRPARALRAAPLLAGLLLLAGCIVRPQAALPPITPEHGGTQPHLENRVGVFRLLDREGTALESPSTGRAVSDAILRRWRARGFIAAHAEGAAAGFSGDADLNLVWNGVRTERASSWARAASLATLGLVPYTVETTVDVGVVAENVRTGETFEAGASDGYRTTWELLLVFAAPFATPGEARTLDALADHLFEQLRAKGAFDRQPRDTAYASRASR